MLEICILVSGGGTNLQGIIDEIKNGNLEATISSVISNNPNAFAITRAKKENIKTFVIPSKDNSRFNEELKELLDQLKPDLILTAGFLKVLPSEIIKAYPYQIMNIHPSLIPAFCGKGYYGLTVHEKALEKGVKISGATVHFVDEGTDTGPIILQKALEIDPKETPKSLQKRVMEECEQVIFPKAVRLFVQNKLKIVNDRVFIEEA